MAGSIDARLAELGIELPAPSSPAANYVPYVVSGNLIFVSGQIPVLAGDLPFVGCVGDTMSVDDGYQAARLCALNIIAQARVACDGDLDRVKRIVKLGGFVNSPAEFSDHPKIINGASDLMVEIFGESIGQHARFAVGAPALPLGVAVEVDAVIEMA
jgi:enamine deaminase RidA (YjgF/YER057c/UK114 family)